MLGDLIATLDQPEIIDGVFADLAAPIQQRLEERACDADMSVPDFVAGAVREFVERADDNLWSQLLTLMRQTEDPGLVAIQTILRWTTESRHSS